MCGRFTQVVKAGELQAMYGAAVPDVERPDRWNGAPTQAFLVCRLDAAGRRVLTLQRWGLVPSWARDRSIGNRLINARSETAAGKEPTWIRLAGGRPFSFAGLWETWGEGESRRESFTILTCPAAPALEPVHARQPVIVAPEEYGGPGWPPRRRRSGCRRRTRGRSSVGG